MGNALRKEDPQIKDCSEVVQFVSQAQQTAHSLCEGQVWCIPLGTSDPVVCSITGMSCTPVHPIRLRAPWEGRSCPERSCLRSSRGRGVYLAGATLREPAFFFSVTVDVDWSQRDYY